MKWLQSLWEALKTPSASPIEGFHKIEANLTPRAIEALSLATKEVVRCNRLEIDTEHVLLGLMQLGRGVAVDVLRRCGHHADDVRKEIEIHVTINSGVKVEGETFLSPRVQAALRFAQEESRNLRHAYIGTEHIFLGLLREEEGIAARVLKDLGMDLHRTRLEILRELDPTFNLEDNNPSGNE